MQVSEALFSDITTTCPDWLPERWREGLIGTRETVEFSGAEVKALNRIARRPMSQWVNDGGFVAMGASGSDWSHDVTPHAAKIMDTWWEPTTREVVFCSVEQDGKTAILYNLVGGSQHMAPGTAMVVMPGEKKAGDVAVERIIPMFRGSRLLKTIVSDRADDTTKMLLRLTNGGRLFMAWASSADALSSWPIQYLYFDETDKYPQFVAKEASPITLGEKRVRTFEDDYKIYKSSTPTREGGGYIYKEILSCPQLWIWKIRCTHCGDSFQAGAEHLDIPEGANVESINSGEHKVHLSCPCCGSLMTNYERKLATRCGAWVCIKGGDLKSPDKVGFHRRAYDCKDVSLKQIAVAKLKADGGDHEAKIAWANGFEAINFEDELVSERGEDHLLAYRSEHPRNLVPRGTARIGLLVDTQQDHFYYTIFAYGYQTDIKMHMIRHGIVQTFDDVAHILGEQFETVDGKVLPISTGLIDSGGTKRAWQKHSRTVEVYAWCVANRKMIPLKGVHSDGALITYKNLEVWPGTNKQIPGGLTRANVQVNHYKDELARLLSIQPDDAGALSFHSEIDSAFSKHFCAEVKDENGDWQHDRKKGRNDYWDCAVYALALREMLKTRIGRDPDSGEKVTTAPVKKKSGSFVNGWKR